MALPLDAINAASAREKSIRHGHPSTLHLWWARRPLATCRAVLFASLVDDPSSYILDEVEADKERQRLFRLIERLVPWEASQNETILAEARLEIARSLERGDAPPLGRTPKPVEVDAYLAKHAPPVLDPFCGGGSIPLEAQRLGLEAHGSDLNPVAVLITKALIEIPPRFAGQGPVNPEARKSPLEGGTWKGAQGLAADVRYYGEWMRTEAEKRIGHLYPKVKLTKEHGGGEATVIAWLWARTVTCPNPACACQMPLLKSFVLSTKTGKERWIEPIVKKGKPPRVEFRIVSGNGKPPDPPKVGRGAHFRCLACGQNAEDKHIKSEGVQGRIRATMTAIVAAGTRERIYIAPSDAHDSVARSAKPAWAPDEEMPINPRWFSPPDYGMRSYGDLFTPRQLVALTTFSDLVGKTMERVKRDARAAGLDGDETPLSNAGAGALGYSEAVATYLAMAVSKLADYNSSICLWSPTRDQAKSTFGRHALPMTWDYCEVNIFAKAAGDIGVTIRGITEALECAPASGSVARAKATQCDAVREVPSVGTGGVVVVTDPPYYDNIGYADLSDFFYVWLRRSMGSQLWPDLFATLLTPKDAELIASPYRHGGDKEKARAFFEHGLRRAFGNMKANALHGVPLTILYAFKQSESEEAEDDDDESEGGSRSVASTGWETMLEGLLQAGCSVLSTWPMRTERRGRMISIGTNALASSIALVCRARDECAPLSSRRDLLADLKRELPEALRRLQASLIAPVDLAQAAIGPGMAIFSRYSKVLEEDGSAMGVRTALVLVNQVLDQVLAEHDGAYDSDTRWAVSWFEQHGFDDGPYGEAETLARAKNTAMGGLVEAGIVKSKGGKVRLLRRDELDPHWTPESDTRLTVWEVTHYLLSAHEAEGDVGAGRLAVRVGEHADAARDLAYRLYTLCERNKWSQAGQGYNALVVGWSDIMRAASIDASGVLPLVDMAPSQPSIAKAKRSVATAARAASSARRR